GRTTWSGLAASLDDLEVLTEMPNSSCRERFEMIVFATCRVFLGLLLLSFLGLATSSSCSAQDRVGITEITRTLLVFSTGAGNVVVSVGPDGALLIGTPSAASTPYISQILASHTSFPVRYAVIAPEDLAHSEGDAGWGRRGAFVAMQENALQRIGGNVMGAPPHYLTASSSSESTVLE
ncbi:MAG TPA: hypothetical protein VIH58_04325, partial [Chthoniobacterales bacterium]